MESKIKKKPQNRLSETETKGMVTRREGVWGWVKRGRGILSMII